MSDDTGGVLLEHYRDQLAEERATKKELERRGQAVIATNGAIATLLFAFGDVTIDTTTGVGQVAAALLLSAMLAFAISVFLGLLVNRPEQYGVTNIAQLEDIAGNAAVWTAPLPLAQKNVAADIAKVVKIAEARNNVKGGWLQWSVDVQVAALALLAVTLLVNVFTP